MTERDFMRSLAINAKPSRARWFVAGAAVGVAGTLLVLYLLRGRAASGGGGTLLLRVVGDVVSIEDETMSVARACAFIGSAVERTSKVVVDPLQGMHQTVVALQECLQQAGYDVVILRQ